MKAMSNNTENSKKRNTAVQPSADTDWFVKLKKDSLNDDTNDEFLAWLQQNPENELEYERCELAWELAGELENEPAVAALISRCDEQIAQAQRQAETGFFAVLAQRLRGLFTARPIFTAGAIAFACITVISTLLLFLPKTYETGIGEQRLVTLPDGSSIILNTNTELAVSFNSDHREIALKRGEALFEVAHDPNRPFEVFAANGLARAVGTRFNVALEQNLVTVSVLEGKVEVRTDLQKPTPLPEGVTHLEQQRNSALLIKGQAVNYWDQGAMAEPQPAQLKRIEAWQQGKLEFDASSLVEVIKEHNRYSLNKIVISNDQLENIQISGIFNAGDTEALLFALHETFGINALHRNNLILLVPKS